MTGYGFVTKLAAASELPGCEFDEALGPLFRNQYNDDTSGVIEADELHSTVSDGGTTGQIIAWTSIQCTRDTMILRYIPKRDNYVSTGMNSESARAKMS